MTRNNTPFAAALAAVLTLAALWPLTLPGPAHTIAADNGTVTIAALA
ncbi:MAG: hypothetical protein ACK442_06400 [Novosphingobium sp.]|jgi:hypothetical protein|nr:hypothetical protein [Brevundimonas sp.]MCZ8323411.1 hypothetical protein [Novosphingobium sp.]